MNPLRQKLGKVLRLERERQQISLSDMASRLRLSDDKLAQLETGKSDAMPSELYYKLFSKSYAEALGIDYTRTIEAIEEDLNRPVDAENDSDDKRLESDGDDESTTPSASKRKPLTTLAYVLGGAVAVIALFFVFNQLFLTTSEGGDKTSSTSTGKLQEASLLPAFASYNWDVPQYQPASEIVLKLRASQQTWATVLADGDTIIFRGLGVGKDYEMKAKYRLRVSIALPRVVKATLNGQLIDLRDPATGRISRVLINQANLSSFVGQPNGKIMTKPTGNADGKVAGSVQSGKTSEVAKGNEGDS